MATASCVRAYENPDLHFSPVILKGRLLFSALLSDAKLVTQLEYALCKKFKNSEKRFTITLH